MNLFLPGSGFLRVAVSRQQLLLKVYLPDEENDATNVFVVENTFPRYHGSIRPAIFNGVGQLPVAQASHSHDIGKILWMSV